MAEGRAQIGLWQSLASPYSAEICATCGFDWLLFDGEHAPNDIPLLLAQLQAVNGSPIHAIARLPYGETRVIKQYLDLGFKTLLIPLVETAAQTAELVRATRYAPEGIRGMAGTRSSNWGRVAGWTTDSNREICLLVQVETRLGLENLDAIAATPGVDGVFIGPADLSADLGYPGQQTHLEVLTAIEGAIARIRAAGKAPGILTADQALAKHYLELGCLFVAVGTDIGVLIQGATSLARGFKA